MLALTASFLLPPPAGGTLEGFKNAIFTDVLCVDDSSNRSVLCTTSTGALCQFHETRTMGKWIQLDDATFALSAHGGMIIVGCSNGKIHVIDFDTLSLMSSFPLPMSLPGSAPRSEAGGKTIYPACYAVACISIRNAGKDPIAPLRIATVYADRSLFVWELSHSQEKNDKSKLLTFTKYRSFVYHRACIWDLVFLPTVPSSVPAVEDEEEKNSNSAVKSLPAGTFVTCSEDNTLRFWNTDSSSSRAAGWRCHHSLELLHTIHLDVPPGAAPGN